MRPTTSTPTQRTKRLSLRTGWFALALLGLLGGMALWLFSMQPTQLHAQTENLVPLDNIVQVAAGVYHTCALNTAGGVKCWGSNSSGQLGDGTSGPGANKGSPVDVAGLGRGVTAIASGAYHTCA
ncbi:MAG TPA: hypothetical protein PL105_00225, partial [Caldilineaceae bacterium]|nr:hypothetical protein [Caldilineaceae bacterium]